MRASESKLLKFYSSPVGKKVITGATGLALIGFVIIHLAGNLLLLINDGGEAFNTYTYTLHSFGWLLYVAEVGLLVVFVFHAVVGITIYLGKRKARQQGYAKYQTAGAPSRQSFSSRTMIWTGLILLVFLVIHIITFRFGPSITEGYTTVIEGQDSRDLYRLVEETFQSIWWVIGYMGVMVMIGFHLRHGFWSALQSLGALSPRLSPLIYTVGLIFALLIAVGFFILPLWIYLNGGA